jgi:chromosome segregation ATPase
MHAALARVGGGGKTPTESGGPASLNFLDVTPERPRRPEQARLSDVDLQAGASGQILQALHRLAQEVQQVRAEVKEGRAEMAQEVQQVRAEVKEGRAEMEKWRAEMEKTVRTVAQNEAQLRTQILGTAEGLVRVEQKLQEEVAQMCAKLEMMQNEQEKKKGNEEEWLKALVREHVEKLAPQLEEKEVARLQEYQQSLEEWLEEHMCREIERQKRGQKEFKLTIVGKVDKFIHEMQEEVTTVLEKCEKLAEQLRQYETPLKYNDQRPQLEQEWPEQGQPPQK